MGIARKEGGGGGGGYKGLPGWFGALFPPRLSGGVGACKDGFKYNFFYVYPFGLGGLKAICAMPI